MAAMGTAFQGCILIQPLTFMHEVDSEYEMPRKNHEEAKLSRASAKACWMSHVLELGYRKTEWPGPGYPSRFISPAPSKKAL
jgi:hypothetical protein